MFEQMKPKANVKKLIGGGSPFGSKDNAKTEIDETIDAVNQALSKADEAEEERRRQDQETYDALNQEPDGRGCCGCGC